MNPSFSRIRKPVKRQSSERYLLMTLLSFAASVSLTRLFLQLTGYPQLGGGTLHIAHLLWGGLLLFVAALLPLILANRWAYDVGALLAGLGVGLFIDEVGKFITQSNDYFYPPAAPIIYAFFLITVLVYLRVRRPASDDPRTELYNVLDTIEEVLDRDLDKLERSRLEDRLVRIQKQTDFPELARLAKELNQFIDSREVQIVPKVIPWYERAINHTTKIANQYIDRVKLRAVLILGLWTMGLVAMWNLVILLFKSVQIDSMRLAVQQMTLASPVAASAGGFWFIARVILECSVGLALLAGGLLILLRNSSLDKYQGGSALEQNRPLVETWRCAQPRDYQKGH